jgi:hypothetical protein
MYFSDEEFMSWVRKVMDAIKRRRQWREIDETTRA